MRDKHLPTALLAAAFLVSQATAAGSAPTQRERYAELLSSSYAGTWVCAEGPNHGAFMHVQWRRSSDRLSFTLSAADPAVGSEQQTYRYVSAQRGWVVDGLSRGAGTESQSSVHYLLHDVASAPDDNGAPTFEGTAQNMLDTQPAGAPIRTRFVFYLAGNEWYQWRYAYLRGEWRAIGRRPCGRDQPPEN